MSKIIHCEWLDKQPAFYKDVKVDGEVIATIHALTKEDYSVIAQHSDNFKDIFQYAIWTILRSVTGHDAKWNFDREPTYETVNVLPDKYFKAIREAILELEKQNKVTEGQEKN